MSTQLFLNLSSTFLENNLLSKDYKQTTSDASAPPPSQSDSTSIHMEATPSGGSTQHDIPQRGEEEISTDGQDPNQNVKVEAFSGCNESNTGCQAIRKTVPEITSEGMANALAEQEKQQQRKEQYHKIYETRKRHALEKNFAAFEAVQHRYILSCGQPVLTIVSNSKETCVIPQDDDETTDYDSDEDGENGREEEDEEEISQRYSEFVQAIGYTEPLDNVAHATVMNYLNTYNLNRLENARVRQFELRIVRSNIAEKILLSIKSQKKESTTRTRMWSRQTWNQEMNKAIRHYKKSDSYWKDRMSVLEERLNRSWNENVARAKQDLQKHHLDV
ncbi:hypothetical protein FBU30_003477 [Linnemannia zychae]|nr:hypothetical protein FBU30_003477 [Linnemannia zychae]